MIKCQAYGSYKMVIKKSSLSLLRRWPKIPLHHRQSNRCYSPVANVLKSFILLSNGQKIFNVGFSNFVVLIVNKQSNRRRLPKKAITKFIHFGSKFK